MVSINRRVCLAALTLALVAGVGVGNVTNPVHAAAPVSHVRLTSDFNGDGYPDLAIGSPNGNGEMGAVTVLPGSASGLTTAGSQYWTMDSRDVAGPRGVVGDHFGASLATGDFNRDGFADLAIGVLGKKGVVVLYGSSDGLQAANSQFLQGIGLLAGFSLTTGDFNRDGFTDLVVGEPFALAKRPEAGSVEIHYGSRTGLDGVTRGTAQRFSEVSIGMPGPAPANNDNFGLSVGSGDFNGDGYSDLAIGIPNALNGFRINGAVAVLYGTRTGLTTAGSQYLPGYTQQASGFAVAAGDFNGDGFSDLVVGEPVTQTAAIDAGAVEIHYGSATGLTKAVMGTAPVISEIDPGMPGPPTVAEDRFGYALTAADFNGDGYPDVAIGVPGKSAAIVVYGSRRGITLRGSQFVPGVGPQAGALVTASGVALCAGDFNNDGYSDLVLGEPFTDTTQAHAGVIEVHGGSANRLVDVQMGTAELFSETTHGMPGPPAAADDDFGLALAGGGRR